jgi:hypothetical protein
VVEVYIIYSIKEENPFVCPCGRVVRVSGTVEPSYSHAELCPDCQAEWRIEISPELPTFYGTPDRKVPVVWLKLLVNSDVQPLGLTYLYRDDTLKGRPVGVDFGFERFDVRTRRML